MESKSGTYALVLEAKQSFSVDVGKLGCLSGDIGYYIYIGSAFGPGGIKARILRHTRLSQNPHWHIDYLRKIMNIREVWYTYDQNKREHEWARIISLLRGSIIPFFGFGSSDCKCKSHLIYLKRFPSIQTFQEKVYSNIPEHDLILKEILD